MSHGCCDPNLICLKSYPFLQPPLLTLLSPLLRVGDWTDDGGWGGGMWLLWYNNDDIDKLRCHLSLIDILVGGKVCGSSCPLCTHIRYSPPTLLSLSSPMCCFVCHDNILNRFVLGSRDRFTDGGVFPRYQVQWRVFWEFLRDTNPFIRGRWIWLERTKWFKQYLNQFCLKALYSGSYYFWYYSTWKLT